MSVEQSVGWLVGKVKVLEEKPAPMPLCPPQIPHHLTRTRTQAVAVRKQWQTAWATVPHRRISRDEPWQHVTSLYSRYHVQPRVESHVDTLVKNKHDVRLKLNISYRLPEIRANPHLAAEIVYLLLPADRDCNANQVTHRRASQSYGFEEYYL
jgi:hypothetical protein